MDLCFRNLALSNYNRQSAIPSPTVYWHPFSLSKQIVMVKFPRKWNQIQLNLEAKVQLGLSLKKKNDLVVWRIFVGCINVKLWVEGGKPQLVEPS